MASHENGLIWVLQKQSCYILCVCLHVYIYIYTYRYVYMYNKIYCTVYVYVYIYTQIPCQFVWFTLQLVCGPLCVLEQFIKELNTLCTRKADCQANPTQWCSFFRVTLPFVGRFQENISSANVPNVPCCCFKASLFFSMCASFLCVRMGDSGRFFLGLFSCRILPQDSWN